MFGFEAGLVSRNPDGTVAYAAVIAGRGVVHLHPPTADVRPPGQGGIGSAIVVATVGDADQHATRAAEFGARITYGPLDTNYRAREYGARDHAGHHWTLSESTIEGEEMTGEPTYIELGVRDADAARTFYGALLGWKPQGTSGPGQVATPTLNIGIHDGDPSAVFEVFFAVTDLDASIERVLELGGNIQSDVNDNPDFGRWVECADDQGVRFGLRQTDTHTG